MMLALVATGALANQQPDTEPDTEQSALYQEAYQLTADAKSNDDFSRIIEICKEGLVGESNERFVQYYRQLMSWALNRRGELLSDEHDNEAALADFEEAIELNPQRWQAIHNRAVCHAMAGNYDQAMADLDQTLELKPDYANARFNRGEIHYERGDYQRAIDDYNQAIRLSPRDSSALNSRGHAYYKLKDYPQALRDYTDAIRMDPSNAAAYTNRGDAYADRGDFARASSDYRAAIRIDPKLGRAYQSAAWLMATCPDERYRDPRLALEAAHKAVELDGEDDFRYLDTLAAAYANAGDFAEATEVQTKVVALAPADQAELYERRLALYEENLPYRDVLAQPQPTARGPQQRTPTSRNPAAPRRQPRSY
jgi:tetratricopeptide (TPR) repeat protein